MFLFDKYKLQWIVVIMLITSHMYSQDLQYSPVNPAYEEFLRQVEYNENFSSMAAPSPGLMDYSIYFKKIKDSHRDYPIAFDLRYAGPDSTSLMTPVKHQMACGACWAFATMGAIESNWMMQDLGAFDLSENNLKNCSGFDLPPCQWGHHFMSTAYLSRGHGPIDEEDDPYDDSNGPCITGLTPVAYLSAARYLPEDHSAFKEAIMNFGGVYNTINFNWNYFNSETNTLCYTGGGTTTHAIVICGWNDTVTTDCGQGVWIAKNSYGSAAFDDGYIYIAYQDTLVLKYNATWPVRKDYDPGMIIHQYDTIGGWPFVGYLDSVAYGIVKYIADKDQYIFSVGTYTNSFGNTIDIMLFDSFDGYMPAGLLTSVDDYYCDFPGFWTIDLPQPVFLNEGDEFYIQIKYNAPGNDFPITVEGYDAGYADPVLTSGLCWVSPDGIVWEPAGEGEENEFDLCIKAYAYEPILFNMKLLLEGPYTENAMHTQLVDDLPQQQPYFADPWNYLGNEEVPEFNNDIVDWILIELRETDGPPESATAETVIDRQALLLRDDGQLLDTNGSEEISFLLHPTDSLYVVIYHRNHVPIMTTSLINFVNGIFEVDLIHDPLQVYYGSSVLQEIEPGIFVLYGGDSNADIVVDENDLIEAWNQSAGQKGYHPADMNFDGEINNLDKNQIWEPNNGVSGQIPE